LEKFYCESINEHACLFVVERRLAKSKKERSACPPVQYVRTGMTCRAGKASCLGDSVRQLTDALFSRRDSYRRIIAMVFLPCGMRQRSIFHKGMPSLIECCGTPRLLFRMILEPIVTANILPVTEGLLRLLFYHCSIFGIDSFMIGLWLIPY